MLKAYEKFGLTINRCRKLISLYSDIKGRDATTADDILRSAVMLATAAFDTYVTDSFEERFKTYVSGGHADKKIFDLLDEAGLDSKEAIGLLNMRRPYRRLSTIIKRYYSKFTTQKMEVVDNVFSQYGIKSITLSTAKKSGKQSIKDSTTKLVRRRHDIVHGGDYNDQGKLQQIDEAKVSKRIDNLQLLVKNMEQIINSRFSKL